MVRWVLHIDMDAFFASVEQMDNPELKGKPIVVGQENRGVVAAASYEARKFGIRSAMPSYQARGLCPHVIFVKSRKERYSEISKNIMDILKEFSPLVEVASIDEAFLDLTGLEHIYGEASDHAKLIQKTIIQRTGLSCSVGLAPVKFLAKIASDMRKPLGFTMLKHEDILTFLFSLPVEKIPGVGKNTLKMLHSFGVYTAGDVQKFSKKFWINKLGKVGISLYERSFGIDDRTVEPFNLPKSESAENTFSEDITSREKLHSWLLSQSERVGANLRKHGLKGRTITLKVKFSNFSQVTKSCSLKFPTYTTKTIYTVAKRLLEEVNPVTPLRLIGVGVSNFGKEQQQLLLFPEKKDEENKRDIVLDNTIDLIRKKFGNSILLRGKVLKK